MCLMAGHQYLPLCPDIWKHVHATTSGNVVSIVELTMIISVNLDVGRRRWHVLLAIYYSKAQS